MPYLVASLTCSGALPVVMIVTLIALWLSASIRTLILVGTLILVIIEVVGVVVVSLLMLLAGVRDFV